MRPFPSVAFLYTHPSLMMSVLEVPPVHGVSPLGPPPVPIPHLISPASRLPYSECEETVGTRLLPPNRLDFPVGADFRKFDFNPPSEIYMGNITDVSSK